MAVSIASKSSITATVPWQQVTRQIVSGHPLEVMNNLETAMQRAEAEGDDVLSCALAASATAFMLADWGDFKNWRGWVERFDRHDAALPVSSDDRLLLARATGALACALLRGDDIAVLGPLGQRLEARLNATDVSDAMALLLAAAALLPWLQMSKNPAAAQALHGQMGRSIADSKRVSADLQYLHAAWLNAWAQHLHMTGEHARVAEALAALDEYLRDCPTPLLTFRRARLSTERAMYHRDPVAAETALRAMLDALHAARPMERVIYNTMAAAVATLQNDSDRALLHVTHNVRDLAAADCPPSIATVYRMSATRVCLSRGNYEEAAAIFGQCVIHAHTAHAAIYRGYEQLALALFLHQQGSGSCDAVRAHLASGLAAVRAITSVTFFHVAPVARATLCALALREGIETEFVRNALREVPVPPPDWADEHWPWAMSLRSFGGFRSVGLADEGRAGGRASNRTSALLMLIAAHGSQGVPVAIATDALWPGQDGDQAENTLSVTLLRLRRLYVEADLIERRGGWLHLNPQRVWTDVVALETHLDAMSESTSSGARRTKYIARLFDLYRGDCLFGIDEDWAQGRRSHYRGRVTLAAQRLLQMSMEGNDFDAAELTLTRAFERGLDAARLLNVVHAAQRSTPAWGQLQAHLKLLESN